MTNTASHRHTLWGVWKVSVLYVFGGSRTGSVTYTYMIKSWTHFRISCTLCNQLLLNLQYTETDRSLNLIRRHRQISKENVHAYMHPNCVYNLCKSLFQKALIIYWYLLPISSEFFLQYSNEQFANVKLHIKTLWSFMCPKIKNKAREAIKLHSQFGAAAIRAS